MLFRLLAVGDMVGDRSLSFLDRHLRELKRLHDVHFTVVNGENVDRVGLTPKQAQLIFDAGADVITLGNHTWNKLQITDFLEENPYILRPANYASDLPGRGWGVFDGPRGLRIGIVDLMGRLDLDPHLDSPFKAADAILDKLEADIILTEFHAEATGEKGAMAYYLDGRVQALWGTHTHVPTADCQILPGGTGFVTDLGMTGPVRSVLGIRPDQSINIFRGGLPQPYKVAEGPYKLNAVLFTIDTDTGKCTAVERVDISEL